MAKKPKTSTEAVPPVHIAEETVPAKLNKSEEIRVEAKTMLDAGGKPTPKAVIERLAARGIEVVSPQVSQVLKRMGVAQRPRKKKDAAAAPPVPTPSSPRKATGDDSFTLHELLAAKQFVEMIGGSARALGLLDALDKIS